MSGTPLCIIDMQEYFINWKYCYKNIIHQINLAKRRNDKIIIVEYYIEKDNLYYNKHKTIENIMKAILNSGCEFFKIIKKRDDGSDYIINSCRKNKIIFNRIRLCGVNRDVCVLETATGIAKRLSDVRVEVSWSATSSDKWVTNESDILDYNLCMKDFPNIVIVN